MNKEEIKDNWTMCFKCKGQGVIRQKIRKKDRIQFNIALKKHIDSNNQGAPPQAPRGILQQCTNCSGRGLISTLSLTPVNNKYPSLAIIGGGIGGITLAVACQHRGIPFTLYERDPYFNSRSQGYGLTLQQASKSIKGLGIDFLQEGITSTRHIVHNTNGEIIGEWGMKKWGKSDKKPRRTNIHIPRQSLRQVLLEQLNRTDSIQWNYQLINFSESKTDGCHLEFLVNNKPKHTKADLIIGADGIRSTVRKLLINERSTPLQYLGCIVILGICPLSSLQDFDSNLLDSETVFQTANGNERIYVMPFEQDSVMWQLSFPLPEEEARVLNKLGATELKKEAIKRTNWHSPIPEIIKATEEKLISGYPVYDRALLSSDHLRNSSNATIIGDAAHPMSPFKGQGANQAILDALSLAQIITKKCTPYSNWREIGLKKSVLTEFEAEMITRSSTKVKGSAEASKFLHSDAVLQKSNEPRRHYNHNSSSNRKG